jgi:hypothetical protein
MGDINALTPEVIQQVLALNAQIQSGKITIINNDDHKHNIYELPPEILEDLEEASAKELNSNINRFTRDLPKYDGGKWTKQGAANPIFVKEYQESKINSLQLINSKYKDAEKLRNAGRAATELFQELRSAEVEADIVNIMERTRRLAVYAFACSKQMDNEAKKLATKALNLPNTIYIADEDEDDDKDLAFSQETVEQIQKARYEDSILKSAAAPFYRGRGNGRGRGRGNYNGYRGNFGRRGGFQRGKSYTSANQQATTTSSNSSNPTNN